MTNIMADPKETETKVAQDSAKKEETPIAEKVATEEKVAEAKAESTETATEDNVNLSDTAQKVMDMVEKMTVLELSELVKAMEKKFGVSAAAPVMAMGAMPAGGGTADAGAPAEEKTEFDVVLVGAGDQKIAVIKVVRELNQALGLVEAKNLVESGEAVLMEKAKKEEAEEAKKKLEEAGAKVELR